MGHPEIKNENNIVYFAGVSYCMYPFTLYPFGMDLPDAGGVYVYTEVGYGFYEPLYIGETDNLKTHIEDYDKWVCVSKHFVNSICVLLEDDPVKREQIVQELIGKQQPICNDD